jgi:hypothetical protein
LSKGGDRREQHLGIPKSKLVDDQRSERCSQATERIRGYREEQRLQRGTEATERNRYYRRGTDTNRRGTDTNRRGTDTTGEEQILQERNRGYIEEQRLHRGTEAT